MSEEIKNNNENPWDSIGGDYVKLETGKAKLILVHNWTIGKVKKFKDDKGNIKEQDEFSCDVLSEDGKPVEKIYATTSYKAFKYLKEIFSPKWPDTTTPVMLKIKRLGEGNATVYDIEEQPIAKPN